MQGFYCESSNFKKEVNIFKRVEIAESIYEGVVEPSHKNPISADATSAGHSRQKRRESALSHTYSKISESVGKRRKRYVYICKGKLKTSLIHSPAHSSDEFKVLGDFSSKYFKSISTKDCGHNIVPGNKFYRQQ